MAFTPAYIQLFENGRLDKRAKAARERLKNCDLCARYCHVDRTKSAKGAACRTGEKAGVSSYGPHFGEEDPLRGTRGSGTIFFTSCNLRCVYCQNWEISQSAPGAGIYDSGREMNSEEIAKIMLSLQEQGCHNINLVSPSHVVAQSISAIVVAAKKGLRLPIVYNTGGYDSPEALKLLDGIVDIYMPDMKYGDSALARKYSKIKDYVEVNHAAVKEMHRQVGDLVLDERGIARRGLLVRHLVLPHDIAGSEKTFRFLAEKISKNIYLNIMDQYHPAYKAGAGRDRPLRNDRESPQGDQGYSDLAYPPTSAEYRNAVELAEMYGLIRLDQRRRRW